MTRVTNANRLLPTAEKVAALTAALEELGYIVKIKPKEG